MKINIIIPTCKLEILKPCIESILKYSDLKKADAEVVVCMNGCELEALDYVKSLGESFRFIWVDKRLGVCEAMNLAAKVCECEYLVKMDDDVRILSWGKNNSWIDLLLGPFLNNDKIGQTGVWLETAWGGYKVLVGFLTMTRKKIWDQLNGLDKAFDPGGGDDHDFSIRVQNLGYEIVQNPPMDVQGRIQFPMFHISCGEYFKNEGINGNQLFARNSRILCDRYGLPIYPEDIKRMQFIIDCMEQYEKKEVN